MKSFKVFGLLGLLMLQNGQGAASSYQNGLDYLAAGDSLKALLELQNCLNGPDCADSSYYWLAILHRDVEGNQKAYFNSLEQFANSGEATSPLLWELALYFEGGNFRKAESYLKKFLHNPEYSEKALSALIRFYKKNAMTDSLSFYRDLESKNKAISYSWQKEETLLKKAIKNLDLEQMEKISRNLLKEHPANKIARHALSIVLFERGEWEASYMHGLKSDGVLSENYSQYRPRLYALFFNGFWETLSKEGEAFLEEMKGYPKERNLYAQALVRANMENKAVPIFTSLIKYPGWKFSDAYSVAALLFKHQKFEEAKGLYLSVKAEELDKVSKEELFYNLARIYEKEDSLILASNQMEKILPNSLNVEHHQFYADVCHRAGLISKAKESLEFLLAMGLSSKKVLDELHVLYRKQGDRENLTRILQEKTSRYPLNHSAKLELAQNFLTLGKWEEAKNYFKDVYEAKNSPEAGLEYAYLLYRDGEYEKALEIAESVYKNSNENSRVINLILSLPDEALSIQTKKYYTQAKLRSEPNNLFLRKRYVLLLEKLDLTNTEEYLLELKRIFRQAPSDTYVLRKIVDELRARNLTKELSVYLETLAVLDDEYRNLTELSEFYFHKQDWDRFIEVGKRAYAKDPNQKLARQFAHGLVQSGHLAKAVEFLGTHLSAFPVDYTSHLMLAELLEEKDLALSLHHAKTAYNLYPDKHSSYVYSKIKLKNGWVADEGNNSLPYAGYEYFPDSIEMLRGLEKFNQKNYSEALSHFSKSGEKFPEEARQFGWKSQYALKDWENMFQKCFDDNELIKFPELINYCGEASWQLGRVEQLDRLAEKKYPTETATLKIFEGLAAFAKGRYSKAEALLANANSASPMYPEIAWAYGKSLFHTDKHWKADSYWKEVGNSIPVRDSLYLIWGISNLKTGKFEEATQIFETGIKKYPRKLPILEQLAYVYEKTGKNKKALIQRQNIFRYFPLNESNNIELGKLWLKLNEPTKALQFLSPLDLNQNTEGLLVKGRSHLQMGNADEAISCAQQILKLDKNFKGAYWLLSQANKQSGNLEASQEYFSKYSQLAGKD